MNDGLSPDLGRGKEPRSEKRRRSGERGKRLRGVFSSVGWIR